MVDIVNNTALHLKAWQTPSADELAEKGLNLLTHYASLVTENAEQFKAFSYCVVADAYFSRRPIVEAVLVEMGQISLQTVYVDGTKLESRAGCYTFVWRKMVEKNKVKLMKKSGKYWKW